MKNIKYPVLIIFSILFPLFFINDPYMLSLFIMTCVNIILATSFQLIMKTGLLNLSHAAFMSIGAYSSAILVTKFGFNFWLSLPVSVLIGSLISFALGFFVLRTKGAYFFIITFAFAEILIIFFSNFFISTFGGTGGVVRIPPPNPISIFGLSEIGFSNKLNLYYLSLFLMFINMWVIIRINTTRIGLICLGLEEEGVLLESIGIDTFKYNLLMFIIGCACASMAGVLYAHTIFVVTPHDFDVHTSVFIVLWVVIGGKDNFMGPVIGAIGLTILGIILQELESFELLSYSFVLILIMLFMPGGLITLPQKVKALAGGLSKYGAH